MRRLIDTAITTAPISRTIVSERVDAASTPNGASAD
jgi:hypothetical protein